MPEIRTATEKDITLIRDLAHAIWPLVYSEMISGAQIDYMLDKMYSADSLQDQMREGAIFLLLSDEDGYQGFASYQHTGNAVYKLHKLYLLPARHGKGLGKKLLQEVITRSAAAGGRTLQLQVNRNNPARFFYERNGFQVVAEADFDIGDGYWMNDYIMEREL